MKRLLVILMAMSIVASCGKKDNLGSKIQDIADIGQLEVLQYELKWISQNEASKFENLKPGNRFALYSGRAILTAKVDFSGFSQNNVQVDQNNCLTITLPEPTIEDVEIGIDEEDIKPEYIKVGKFRSDFSNDEKLSIRQNAQNAVEKEVVKTDILVEAEANTREIMGLMFKPLGFDCVTVKFEKNEETK